MKGSCVVCQSGGPTCVINASLAGVIRAAIQSNDITNIFGSLYGIDGLIQQQLIDLKRQNEEEIANLLTTPGAILGSARHCLSSNIKNAEYEAILATIQKYDIRFILFIGGNDSMDSVSKLSSYFDSIHYECKVIGIPKTIDNDLVLIDHTPGYGSAIKYIATSISEMKEDTSCYQKGRVTIVEIMGRDAGWLTAGSKLASLNGNGPDLIYLPEIPFQTEQFILDVEKLYKKQQKVFVCISEGIKNKDNVYIVNENHYVQDNDVFGHMQLGGTATVLADVIHSRLNIPVRAIELNLPQRCAAHLASLTDITEAYNCGFAAINVLLTAENGKMISMVNKNKESYEIEYKTVNVHEVANQVKHFPSEWILNGNDIAPAFLNYALPLIQGQPELTYENGMIRFAKLDKTIVK